MSVLIITLVLISGLIALVIAIRGSFRRDSEFKRRYAEASPEERAKLEAQRARMSWVWLNYHGTSRRWMVAAVITITACCIAALYCIFHQATVHL
jgi:hypothetical protein